MPEQEKIDLPNGQSVVYVDADHSYWRWNPKTGKRGKRLTGVTTAVKTLDYNPENLLRWAAKTQCVGIADLFLAAVEGDANLSELDWLSTQESIWRKLEEYELTFEHVRDRAATRGTQVHQVAFQALGMGRPVPDLERLTPEERGHARAIMSFWLDYEPEPERVEQVVYSERLGVAGRLDFLGRLKGYDGLCVVDAKTGKFLSAGAHAQVGGGYPLLAAESGFLKGPGLLGPADAVAAAKRVTPLLLQTREDGTYDLIEATGTPESFELAVATYRAAGQINYAAKKARDAARTRRRTDQQITAMTEAMA